MDIKTEKVTKEICKECKGNGFIRVPYHQAGDEQWADLLEPKAKELADDD